MSLSKNKILLYCAALAAALCFAPTYAFAGERSIDVTLPSQISSALLGALPGDSITFVLQGNICLGQGGGSAFRVPQGVTATITNKPGGNVCVTRESSDDGTASRIDIQGKLVIEENAGGGALTFDGEDLDFGEHPQFAVKDIGGSTGSALTIKSGTIKNENSYYGAIYAADGAGLSVEGGLFRGNRNKDLFYGTCQGGVIWAANCNVSIAGGTFVGNTSGNSGGVIYYEGRTLENRLSITGGVFSNNTSEGFCGGAVYIDCFTGSYSLADISGARFANNVTRGLGGAIYITVGAEVSMADVCAYGNTATTQGGGVWNCSTGGGGYYAFHGMFLAENEVTGSTPGAAGDDFYSMPKAVDYEERALVYLSDYAFTGERVGWTHDEAGNRRSGLAAAPDYYQNSNQLIALKSGLPAPAVTPTGTVTIFTGNSAKSGGAIANNGALQVGEDATLSLTKETAAQTDELFSFTVTLARENLPLSGSFLYDDASGISGRMAFGPDGVGALLLASGQTVTVHDLPYGAGFVIDETALPRGWVLASSENATGTIDDSLPQAASIFTNDKAGPTPVPNAADDALRLPQTGDGAPFACMAATLAASLHARWFRVVKYHGASGR